MSFEYNKNYSEISKILKAKLVKNNLFTEIRKTDEFIKFIELLVSKEKIEMCELITNWFKQNGAVKMPWNPERMCVDIDLMGIKKLNSSCS